MIDEDDIEEQELETEAENLALSDFNGEGSISFATWHSDLDEYSPEMRAEIDQAAKRMVLNWLGEFVVRLAQYLCEDGRSKVEGAGIRAFVFAWFVSPRLKKLKQPQLAGLMDRKHKQSVGREISKFRDQFGILGELGLQSEAARESCRKREIVKQSQKTNS